MVDWDALEQAGHDLTHCGMIGPGTNLYYCENCGAILWTKWEGVVIFHLPAGSKATQAACHGPVARDAHPLKHKLEALMKADLEALKDI